MPGPVSEAWADPDDDEPICESVSPHGNRCMFVAGHEGAHEIHHMMGEEMWGSDKWPDEYHPVIS